MLVNFMGSFTIAHVLLSDKNTESSDLLDDFCSPFGY
jgi:hypothetical protein